MRIASLHLTNFLSYRDAGLSLGNMTALVGPNASGKSNAVAALKLLGDIPRFGLQTALARRGGFDQLRHRSGGRPFDPGITIEFQATPEARLSKYELRLRAVAGKRWEVKQERGHLYTDEGEFSFNHSKKRLTIDGHYKRASEWKPPRLPDDFEVPSGQSALPAVAGFGELYFFWTMLQNFQIVEINPSRVREFQDPSPLYEMEPDGSNAASVFEQLAKHQRRELIDELSAIVPGLVDIEPRHFSNKLTISFIQKAQGKRREFLANQMSDGTLRAFGILMSLVQSRRQDLVVIEEPEVAIHLGALRTLVDILGQHSEEIQILLTTHSADIVDAIDIEDLRVVWAEGGTSRLSPVAAHTRQTLKHGLITPGELLRSDALDPAIA